MGESKDGNDAPAPTGRIKMSKTQSVYADLLSYPSARVKIYSPPRQITKWGSKQALKHVGWAELFFDLFYVAGFYNLGGILVEEPSFIELLFFFSCIFSLLQLWHEKTFFDARFTYADDIFHKVTDSLTLMIVATAVANIGPASKMSNSSAHDNMFLYSLMMLLGTFLTCLRYVETYFFGEGQTQNIEWSSKSWIYQKIPTMGFYLAATIISGMAYYGNNGEKDILTEVVSMVKGDNSTLEDEDDLDHDHEDDKHRLLSQVFRGLAESSSSFDASSIDCESFSLVPILLILAGFLSGWVYVIVTVFFCLKKESMKDYTIPINADYAIHRYGEVIMLILGESVLSLLIVDSSDQPGLYFQIFYAGVLTLILLQFCHYRSMPQNPETHAFRHHSKKTIVFIMAFQFYSAALIMVGASYKLFLKKIKTGDDKHRLLLEQMQKVFPEYSHDEDDMRFLADESYGGDGGLYYCMDRTEIEAGGYTRDFLIADLFGWGFAFAYFALLIMIITNTGPKKQLEIWKKKPLGALVIVLIRLALILLMFFVAYFETDVKHLAWIGLGVVAAQVITRYVDDIMFPEEHSDGGHHHHHEDECLVDESSHHSHEGHA